MVETPTIDKYVELKLKKVQRARTPKGRLKAVIEYSKFVKGLDSLWSD
ncbi:MAG: hypothetical protein ABSA33_05970 [Candidatus Micrarchaeaceae archaeon]